MGCGLKAMMSELTQIFLLIQGGLGRDLFKGVGIKYGVGRDLFKGVGIKGHDV